ncbi:MAG: trigger factor [Rhodospirillales bacterium]|nr:trigger factor [Rhodospirillales bacterium]
MQVKELKNEGLSFECEVTVTAKEIDKHVDEKLQEYCKTMKMPGFRPGKVPLSIAKQRYGKAVMGEVLESAVNENTAKLIKDKKLRPAMQPKIEVKSFDEGKDLTYTMAVDLLPEFKIMDVKKLKLEKPVAKADKKEIDEALERIASQRKNSTPIEGKRASKKGDIVVIDFHGRTAKDNKPHPGMHSHDHHLELGGGQFIPGFEDQLIGKKAGEKVEVKVSFPEAYHAEELAGQDAIFDVEIKEIREAAPVEINDEFAKSLGMEDAKALRNAVEQQIQGEYDNLSRTRLKRALLDALDDGHDFDVPQGMLDLELENVRQQVMMERQEDVKDGKLQLSKDEEEELEAIAGRRVRLGLILSEIGQANNIQVSDQEIQRAVINEAQKFPGQEAQVFEYFRSNRQALEALRAPVFEDKVVDFIFELADISEKKVTIDELTADDEEETYKGKKKSSSKKSSPAKKETAEKKPAAKKPAAKKESSAKKK